MSRFANTIFGYLDEVKNTINLRPLYLGGFASTDGGAGGPPGGFQGYLPQLRVAYDTTEAEISGFLSVNPYTASGVLISASLLDNLNHIRYRLSVVEAVAGVSSGVINATITVYDSGSLVDTDITVLDFGTGLNVTQTAGNRVLIDAFGHTVQDEGTPLTQRSNLNFVGSGVAVTDDAGNDATIVTIDNTGGHTILDEGTPLTQRAELNFTGDGVYVSDIGGITTVTISGVTVSGGSGASTFLDLTDTPSTIDSTVTGRVLKVNHLLNKIEFESMYGGYSQYYANTDGTTLTLTTNAYMTINSGPGASSGGTLSTISSLYSNRRTGDALVLVKVSSPTNYDVTITSGGNIVGEQLPIVMTGNMVVTLLYDGTNWRVQTVSTFSSGATAFTGLTDTPSSYGATTRRRFAKVNSNANGLEFTSVFGSAGYWIGDSGTTLSLSYQRMYILQDGEGASGDVTLDTIDNSSSYHIQGDCILLVYDDDNNVYDVIIANTGNIKGTNLPITLTSGDNGILLIYDGTYWRIIRG